MAGHGAPPCGPSEESCEMSRLPVIVGFGGYNAAGRSSFHHAFRRTVIESLSPEERQQTLTSLAVLMKLVRVENGRYVDDAGASLTPADIEQRFGQQILDSTLVRRIEKRHLDVDAAHWHKELPLDPGAAPMTFTTLARQLPERLPAGWSVEALESTEVRVIITAHCDIKVDSSRELAVNSAGQLPCSFEPGEHYNSRVHPRSLQLTNVAAADALHSSGPTSQQIMERV